MDNETAHSIAAAIARAYVSDWSLQEHLMRDIEVAISDAERRGWGKAADEFGENGKLISVHIGPLYNAGWNEAMKYVAKYCRAQANKEP